MSEECSICGKFFQATGSEIWTGDDDFSVGLDTFDELFIIVDVVDKKYYICEICYKSSRYLTVENIDLAEVHFEFGLAYKDHEKNDEAIVCLMKSLEIQISAQTLSSIAYGLTPKVGQF
jgi:hypothetical protein